MKKFATIAALSLMAQQAMGACDTTNNFIGDLEGFTTTGGVSNADIVVDNTWLTCGSMQTALKGCCPKTDVATFQTKATALIEDLKTAVSTRDQYILDRRGDVLEVRDSIASIQSSLETLSSDNASIATALSAFTGAYEDLITSFTEDFTALKEGFVTLQKNRVTCFEALVQAQVTLWCAACMDDASATHGIGASAPATYGTVFEGFLANACSAYVASAVEQGGILSLYSVSGYLAALASALEKLSNGDAEGALTDITEFITDIGTVTVPTNELHRLVTAPATCTTSSCSWTTDLFATGALDVETATVGGVVVSSRRLQGVEAPAGRMLTLDLDPSDEATGITVTFPENPGNVDNDQNSAVRNGAIACAITALAALF